MPGNETLTSLVLFQLLASGLFLLFRRWMQRPGSNRFMLLGIYLLPFLLLVPLPSFNTEVTTAFYLHGLPEVSIGISAPSEGSSWHLLYFIPTLFILLTTLTGIIRMSWLRSTGRTERSEGLLLIRHRRVRAPFSFFYWIFLPERKEPDLEKWVLLHEKKHARQLHSIDMLIARSIRALFWFNPFLYILEKEMALNHEYLADRACLEEENEKNSYSEALVSAALGRSNLYEGQAFSLHSQLKNRIHMIQHSSTPKKGGYFFLLPLLLLSLSWVACQQNKPSGEIPLVKEIEVKEALKASEVDELPEMNGGTEALMSFLGSQIKYPEHLKEEGKVAKVMVQFTVTETGKVTDISILNKDAGNDPAFESEAYRAVYDMPDWKPGKKDGKAVPVSMVLPIRFTL